MLVTNNVLTRDEVVRTIQELATKLDRRPKLSDVCEALNVAPGRVQRLFGSYAQAVQASGLVPLVRGTLKPEELFEDWRTVARKLGKIPTVQEYGVEGKHCVKALTERFGGWRNVAAGMIRLGDNRQLWAGWEDIRALAERYVVERAKFIDDPRPVFVPEPMEARAVYGAPLTDSSMATEPTNELGVVLLFGALARQLGFVVLKLHPQFPDCEALRQVDEDRWQRVRIEFEFESRNFVDHGHDPQGCDLIVCWKHTWEGCKSQVLELSKVVKAAPGR